MKKKLKTILKATIKTIQNDFNSDVLGFGATIYKHDPKEWKKIKDNWEEEFPKLQVKIDVTVKINHLGAIDNSFLQNMKD